MTKTHYEVPAGARPSASLLLLRDASDAHADTAADSAGLQTLMLLRAERSDGDMRSGAAVFPGGVLDARDRQAHVLCIGADDAALSARLGLAAGGLDYAVAALRETFEEVGILFACQPDGGPADIAAMAADMHPWRARLNDGEVGIAEFCRAFDLCLDLRGLHYSAHWLTPPGMPKRWDARFFTALAPAGQVPTADGGEAQALLWLAPPQALDPARGLKLLPAMRHMLAELQAWPDAATALKAIVARTQVMRRMPRVAASSAASAAPAVPGSPAGASKAPRLVLPDDLAYAEIGRLDPDGLGTVSARIVPGVAVRLSPQVWRVTAPNPGVMTGPGTNSYLVGSGTPGCGWTVIDPGPVDAGHTQALMATAALNGGHIERILVTHTHRDHSPGAAPLAAASGAPVWGRAANHSHWQDESFAPVHQPAHGERVDVGGGAGGHTGSDTGSHTGPSVMLRAIHTPGHASNHLCWLLENERLLFTGDQVMQGSTVVINPPDGDMAAYLAALRGLLQEDLEWLAPGHGFLIDQPHAVIGGLIAHRLKREAKVVAALSALAPAPLEVLVARVYDDVSPALHGVAQRSLLAHLLKLQAEGRAHEGASGWAASG